MNLRLEHRASGESHQRRAAALLAQQWRRDRPYFIQQTNAPGAWLRAALRLRPGEACAPGADRVRGAA